MNNPTPFSEACERNKEPILDVLRHAFKNARSVLEIGSGTGQHAAHFASNLPHLIWQPTELEENLPGLRLRLREEGTASINDPIFLDVSRHPWPVGSFDAVFTANTFHIMSSDLVEQFFHGLGQALYEDGTLCVYGPFNYGGNYTSESNERFDGFLRGRDPKSGIRDFEWVDSLAGKQGLKLIKDNDMPANNRLLEWRKA